MIIEHFNSGEHRVSADGVDVWDGNKWVQFHPSVSYEVPVLNTQSPKFGDKKMIKVRSADYKIPMKWSDPNHGYTLGTLIAMAGDVFWTFEQVSDFKISIEDLCKRTYSNTNIDDSNVNPDFSKKYGAGAASSGTPSTQLFNCDNLNHGSQGFLMPNQFIKLVEDEVNFRNLGINFTSAELDKGSVPKNLPARRIKALKKVIHRIQQKMNFDAYVSESVEIIRNTPLYFNEIIKTFRSYARKRFLSGFYTLYDPDHADADRWGLKFGGIRDHNGKIFGLETSSPDVSKKGAQSLGDNINSIFQYEISELRDAIQQNYSTLAMVKENDLIDKSRLPNKGKYLIDHNMFGVNALQPNASSWASRGLGQPNNSWNKFDKSKINSINPTIANHHSTTSLEDPGGHWKTMKTAGTWWKSDMASGSDEMGTGPTQSTKWLSILVRNSDHFELDAAWVFSVGHELALEEMSRAKNFQIGSQNQLNAFHKALAIEGFAGHFLTDLFAAGHITTPSRTLRDVHTAGYTWGGMLTNAMHDEENAYGKEVTNADSRDKKLKNPHLPLDTWKAFGDYAWVAPENSKNRKKMFEAIQESVNELITFFKKAGASLPNPDTYRGSMLHPSLPKNFEKLGIYIKNQDYNPDHMYLLDDKRVEYCNGQQRSCTVSEDEQTDLYERIPIKISSSSNTAQLLSELNCKKPQDCSRFGPTPLWDCEKNPQNTNQCKSYNCGKGGEAIKCQRRNILNETGTGNWQGQPLYMRDSQDNLWKRGTAIGKGTRLLYDHKGTNEGTKGGGGKGRTRIDSSKGIGSEGKRELERAWPSAGPGTILWGGDFTVKTSPYLIGEHQDWLSSDKIGTGSIQYDVSGMRNARIKKINDNSGTEQNPRRLTDFTVAQLGGGGPQEWRQFYDKSGYLTCPDNFPNCNSNTRHTSPSDQYMGCNADQKYDSDQNKCRPFCKSDKYFVNINNNEMTCDLNTNCVNKDRESAINRLDKKDIYWDNTYMGKVNTCKTCGDKDGKGTSVKCTGKSKNINTKCKDCIDNASECCVPITCGNKDGKGTSVKCTDKWKSKDTSTQCKDCSDNASECCEIMTCNDWSTSKDDGCNRYGRVLKDNPKTVNLTHDLRYHSNNANQCCKPSSHCDIQMKEGECGHEYEYLKKHYISATPDAKCVNAIKKRNPERPYNVNNEYYTWCADTVPQRNDLVSNCTNKDSSYVTISDDDEKGCANMWTKTKNDNLSQAKINAGVGLVCEYGWWGCTDNIHLSEPKYCRYKDPTTLKAYPGNVCYGENAKSHLVTFKTGL